MGKYKIYGPVRDSSQFEDWYQVIGPKGGIKSEWYFKVDAIKEVKRLNYKDKR